MSGGFQIEVALVSPKRGFERVIEIVGGVGGQIRNVTEVVKVFLELRQAVSVVAKMTSR